jgi:hypothetical protein
MQVYFSKASTLNLTELLTAGGYNYIFSSSWELGDHLEESQSIAWDTMV